MKVGNISFPKPLIAIGAILLVGAMSFNSMFVYNEAGYQTHIRTIGGTESVETDIGYHWKGFGRATPWKQAQTIQFTKTAAETVDDSVNVTGYRVTFLGNVDAGVEASTRFLLPQGEQFMKIAREYRTPENFYHTAVVPAIKETLQSTASLMSADDYFAGGRSEFSSEFEQQLQNGQYVIERKEVSVQNSKGRQDSANAVVGAGKDEEEFSSRSQFKVVKRKTLTGEYLRKPQAFRNLGVNVVEARITDVEPNTMYRNRMVKVQEALAGLAIARQDRLKEEESKLLVIAKGEREVEEQRQTTLKEQIAKTTNAQTAKQLAEIAAQQKEETAKIEQRTMDTQLETARLEALKIKTLADAQAYEKRVLIEADGALAQKLTTLEAINSAWANAAAKAPVSSVVMGGESGSGSRQSEIGQYMQIMAAQSAKQLGLDFSIKK